MRKLNFLTGHHRQQLLVPAWLGLVTLGAAAQVFLNIHLYTVNILFSDQWDTFNPLFYNYGPWQSFAYQFGPHRLGVGIFVSQAIAVATRWNTRTEAFIIGFVLLLIAVSAIYLKWRLFKHLTLWDSLIPLICLSLTQVHVHPIVPFPAYSAIPVLLIMVYAICLTWQNVKIRYGSLLVINFLLLFTGWGLFAGFLTPCLLTFLVFRHAAARDPQAKRWAMLALFSSVLSLVTFLVDYRFWPSVECFRFPHYPVQDYGWFLAHLFANSVGLPCGYSHFSSAVARGFGVLLFVAFVVVLGSRLWKLSREREYEPKTLVIVFLVGFSFLFAVNTSLGRVCLGVCAANAERYQNLLMPAWLGLYFFAVTLGKSLHRAGLCLLILGLCFLMPQMRASSYARNMRRYAEIKAEWKACYLETEDAASCDRRVGRDLGRSGEVLQEKLNYLKARRLNLYSDK